MPTSTELDADAPGGAPPAAGTAAGEAAALDSRAADRAGGGPAAASRLLVRLRPVAAALCVLLIAGFVIAAVHSLVREVSYAEVVAAIRATPASAMLLALVATTISYVALIGYDLSGLHFAGLRLPLPIVSLASFASYALGNTVGLGALTGGAVRYRIYSTAGVEPVDIGRIVLFAAVGFGAGITAVGAVAVLLESDSASRLLATPAWALQAMGGLVLALVALLLVLCATRRRPLAFGRLRLPLPSPALVLIQIAISTVDIVAAGTALWILLPTAGVGFGAFIAIYAVAIVLSVLSHVPGGLGVFETVVLLAFGRDVPLESLAASLLLFRAVYYLLPLFLGVALLALFELRRNAPATARAVQAAGRVMPLFLGTAAFTVGAMLLASGVTPSATDTLRLLQLHVPLPLVEASHFLSSIFGLALLVVARGLIHRLDAAWWVALVAAAVSFVLALTKGFALGEMAVIGFLVVILLAARQEFDRRASLLDQPLNRGWLLAVAGVVAGMIWILLFAYRHIAYTHELWWQFAFEAQAPRALRAATGVAVATVAVGLWHLLRPAQGHVEPPPPEDLARAAGVLGVQERPEANLALMGDKSLLFSDAGDAFVMYAKQGRTWAALYDPVGARSAWRELIWRFIELADRHGGRAVFYEVSTEGLPLYLDAGLRVLKLGEEARVLLDGFNLDGARRTPLRYAVNRGTRDGLALEIVPPAAVPALLDELRGISDAWLAEHAAREKRFSLGFFEDSYVSTQPVALVRQQGRAVAFATLMTTGMRSEVSIDLMRHRPDASRHVMDFLFVRLLLHFKAEGYAWFGLGMAPLSGLETHPLAPRWHRLGNLLWSRGRALYNFQGLRAYKEKFDPVWRPRYLAAPGGLDPYVALADIAALAGGGLSGLMRK